MLENNSLKDFKLPRVGIFPDLDVTFDESEWFQLLLCGFK